MRRRLSIGSVYIAAAICAAGVIRIYATAEAEGPQQAPASSQSAASTHLYHLTAFRAALGRTAELRKLLSTPSSPNPLNPDFAVVFRHREGHEWDFLLVEHIGEKLNVDLSAAPPPQPDTPLSQLAAWHGDTLAAGPPLDDFRRVLNLQATAGQGGVKAVYIISDYMAAPGHRGKLRSTLDQIASQTPGRSVTLTHVEGAPWTFLTITRYDSWQQFAKEQESEDAEEAKDPSAPGMALSLREHMTMHHDTLVTVAAVHGPSAAR